MQKNFNYISSLTHTDGKIQLNWVSHIMVHSYITKVITEEDLYFIVSTRLPPDFTISPYTLPNWLSSRLEISSILCEEVATNTNILTPRSISEMANILSIISTKGVYK